jgi:hypothetical protein
MEKIVRCSYNKDADELNISLGKPQNAISLEVGDEIYVRLHPKTKEILGFTILHFEERALKEEKIFAIPLIANFRLSKPVKEPSSHLVAS